MCERITEQGKLLFFLFFLSDFIYRSVIQKSKINIRASSFFSFADVKVYLEIAIKEQSWAVDRSGTGVLDGREIYIPRAWY